MPATKISIGRLLRTALPPLFLTALVVLTLREPLSWWLHGEQIYDQEAIKEWVREARVYNTLPELVRGYLEMADKRHQLAQEQPGGTKNNRLGLQLRILDWRLARKREEIEEHLKALGNPPTKMYPGQLPLFPIIYRLTVTFAPDRGLREIVWDSELPRQGGQYRELSGIAIDPAAAVDVQFHLHAYMERQFKERQEVVRRLQISGLGIFFVLLAFLWVYLNHRREQQRERQRILAQQQLNEAERLRLEEELRRREAEQRQQDTERQNLELRSQIFANIGIMAGSYAHNIKNLLVRPNDLLRRCLEEEVSHPEQNHMLHEVQQTLGTVTERLQQILQTVRRDPGKVEKVRINLNQLGQDIQKTWADLAREKWKLVLDLDLWKAPGEAGPGPLWIEGDLSHLQQALENLLFNARDATFEMRNHLREQARGVESGERRDERRESRAKSSEEDSISPLPTPHSPLPADRRKALIAAAGWKGMVTIRTRLREDRAILEMEDNGIGMTEEVRHRCTETHFSTKRNNALFAGLSAGMGLGLSFVLAILEHHGARLEIDSKQLEGTTFRISLPLVSR